jgi:hypothetical protein
MLQFMEKNWWNWSDYNSIDFSEYMILTCQQIYYRGVYNEIRSLNEVALETVDWVSRINDWNEKIIDVELINFDDIETAIAIPLLIEIRGRIMFSLVK